MSTRLEKKIKNIFEGVGDYFGLLLAMRQKGKGICGVV
jgi:hypothetical protein